jgi:hypothetical protein
MKQSKFDATYESGAMHSLGARTSASPHLETSRREFYWPQAAFHRCAASFVAFSVRH